MLFPTQRTLSSLNTRVHVCTLGHKGHGKTTLLAAITRVLALANEAMLPMSVEQLESISQEEEHIGGLSIAHAKITYSFGERHFIHVDYPGHTNCIKGLVAGLFPLDGAILVVSASDGPQPQTREQLALARQLNVPALAIFLNKIDQVNDQELLDVVALEIRELLFAHQFNPDLVPCIQGSALQALESQGDLSRTDPDARCIWDLLEYMRTGIPVPLPAREKPFFLPIEEVFVLKKRGLAAAGYVEQGVVQIGDTLALVGMNRESRTVLVTGIEMFQKMVTRAEAGNNIGCVLEWVERADIARGQVLATPGSIQAHTTFVAHIYILTAAEGGRHRPFRNHYRPCIYIRKVDLVGQITLPEYIEEVLPGDHVEVEVRLSSLAALAVGTRFTVREGGRVVGIGVCTHLKV